MRERRKRYKKRKPRKMNNQVTSRDDGRNLMAFEGRLANCIGLFALAIGQAAADVSQRILWLGRSLRPFTTAATACWAGCARPPAYLLACAAALMLGPAARAQTATMRVLYA